VVPLTDSERIDQLAAQLETLAGHVDQLGVELAGLVDVGASDARVDALERRLEQLAGRTRELERSDGHRSTR
jgi:hypothetical protein